MLHSPLPSRHAVKGKEGGGGCGRRRVKTAASAATSVAASVIFLLPVFLHVTEL
ncbi:hypothetical protein HN51_001644, partial [Arachis hypogaea]